MIVTLGIVILVTVGVVSIKGQKNDSLEIEFILVYEDGTEEVYKRDIFSGLKRVIGLVVTDPNDPGETPISIFKINTYLTVFWDGPKQDHTIAGYTYIRIDGLPSLGGDDGSGGYLIPNPSNLVAGENTLLQTINYATGKIEMMGSEIGEHTFTATAMPTVGILFSNGDTSDWVGDATASMTFAYKNWEITDVQISFSTSYLSVVD